MAVQPVETGGARSPLRAGFASHHCRARDARGRAGEPASRIECDRRRTDRVVPLPCRTAIRRYSARPLPFVKLLPQSVARPLLLVVGLALGLAPAAGCASVPPVHPSSVDVAGSLDVASVPAPDGLDVVTLYPQAHRAEYGERLLPLDEAEYLDETSAGFDRLLVEEGLDRGWPRIPFEGYALVVTVRDGRTLVLRAARDDEGRAWARRALEQLTVERDGRRYARACRVLDWPAFVWRGNKRPRAWERSYRANFAWGTRDGDAAAMRNTLVFAAPRPPFDASDASVERVLAEFGPWQERGVTLFALKFDDVGFELTPESELAFGRFPRALVSFVERVRRGLVERSSEARLFLLPQTYWWDDPRLAPFANAVRNAGGFHPDVGLVMTGPEVISPTIDPEGLYAARVEFGMTSVRALVYDNLGREGDWGPLTGRSALLRFQADAVFGERGTPVHRLTRLDWSWNPEDYDPERSWRRAVYELAGPEGYDALLGACRAFRDGAPREAAQHAIERFAAAPGAGWNGPLARAALVESLSGDLLRLTRSGSVTSRGPAPRR